MEIKNYHEEIKCTIIYVTHDQGEALTLSDRIVIMDQGKIIQIDNPKNIYELNLLFDLRMEYCQILLIDLR